MAEYAIAQHVFICLDGEQLVILDLRADRYWTLDAAATAGLSALIAGWPESTAEAASGTRTVKAEAGSADPENAIELLLDRGWLTEAASGKVATPVRGLVANRELMAPAEREFASHVDHALVSVAGRELVSLADAYTSKGHAAAFLGACLVARLLLRLCPLRRIIRRVQRRASSRATQQHPLDVVQARRLVAAFAHYRIFLFASRNECLYDSLALLEFLARHSIFPQWVFGVRTRPFAAHCWIQQEGIVFNDTLEHIAGYTPIMVI